VITVPYRLGFLFLILFAAAGCSGGEGDVCQLESDCNDGLMCCKASRAMTERGTCETMCITPPRRDAGPTPDSGPDTGTPDTGMPDTGTEDAGDVDAGEIDADVADSGENDSGIHDSGTRDSGLLPDTGILPDTGL
jgi:hypothetical protein